MNKLLGLLLYPAVLLLAVPSADAAEADRDLTADLFFGNGLDFLLPPTGAELASPETAPLFPGSFAGSFLDPQLDTGSAVGSFLPPAPPAVPDGGGKTPVPNPLAGLVEVPMTGTSLEDASR